jgi:hypothetical protein
LSFFTEALFDKYPDIWVENHLEVLGSYAKSRYFYSALRKGRRLPTYNKIRLINENLYQSDPDTWAESYNDSLRSVYSAEGSYFTKDEKISFMEKSLKVEKSLLEKNPIEWAERYADSLYSISLKYDHKQREKEINAIKEAIEVCEKYKGAIFISSSHGMYYLNYDRYKARLEEIGSRELWSSGYRHWIRRYMQWLLLVDILLIVGAFFWLLYFIFSSVF